ncbi:MAG: hypothetical protein K2Q06_12425, partial [Parvularculaceae bacterium]|nr:hypothetical protein [Parvularculaceae bacterium]
VDGTIGGSQGPTVIVSEPAFFAGPTFLTVETGLPPVLVPSFWIWPQDSVFYTNAFYKFTFDLTGYDLNSVNLRGLIGAQIIGIVELNGTQILVQPSSGGRSPCSLGPASNYTTLTPFTAAGAALFRAGLNELVVSALGSAFCAPNPTADFPSYGIRAAAVVTADLSVAPPPSEIPLPAAGFVFVAGLAGIASLARRRAAM